MFTEFTIYGVGDTSCTDGEYSKEVEDFCLSLSQTIQWDDYTEEDDCVAVVRVEDGEYTAELFPGDDIIPLSL